MADRLKITQQDWMTYPATRTVFNILLDGGYEARFVGGCVRDALIGKRIGDIDIATDAVPERVVELLEGAGIRTIPTGIDHGTVTAVVDGHSFEVTTLRRDVETDGRHAVVAFTTDWKEDAARRDFTMNAMSLSLEGEVYDYFGGLGDLEAGRVRFVGKAEQRIREDVLRMLRFYRFHAHYGIGEPDPEARAACRSLAHLLPTLSRERVRSELIRLLSAKRAGRTLLLMEEDGVLDAVLTCRHNARRTAAMVQIEHEREENEPIRRLAALLDDDARSVSECCEALRLSAKERERVENAHHALPLVARISGKIDLDRALYRHGTEAIRDATLIHEAENGRLPIAEAVLLAADSWIEPELPVAGRDILERGFKPGPEVGRLICAVEEWWIEKGFAPDREVCLEELERLIHIRRSELEGEV